MLSLTRGLRASIDRGGDDLTVLAVRLGAMGDVVRTIPAVDLLRRALPAARLLWLVDEGWRVVLDGHPAVDEVIPLPRKGWREASRSPRLWPALAREVAAFREGLRRRSADVAIDFHGNLRSGLSALWSGAPVRVGYDGHQQKEGNHWFTTHRVPSGPRRTPRMERNLSLVAALGLPTAPLPDTPLPLAARGSAAAESLLAACGVPHGGVSVICPGASRAQARKKPPAALLAAATARLAARGVLPLVVWGPGELPDAEAVVEASAGTGRLAPATDLPTLAALLARSRLYVGGDTGPLHIACAVGCPVVGIYGPTDPVVNRPWGPVFRVVAPPGRIYTGIQRIDRRAGRFEGVRARHVERAVDELLDAWPGARADSGGAA